MSSPVAIVANGPGVRVLHVIPGIAPKYGGPSQAIVEMCRALKPRGVESLIATTDADGAGRLAVEYNRPIDYQGVQAIFFQRQASEAFKYSHPLSRWLNAHVKEFDLVSIDAIFSHSSLAAARACQRSRVPYVVRPLGSLSQWSLQQKRLRKSVLWHLGVTRMLREAAAIQYLSAEERRQVESALGLSRGVVIPFGVEDTMLNPPDDSTDFRSRYEALGALPYVLVLSRIHPKKGLELFLPVFLEATRSEEFQRWRLVVAGDGKPRYVARLKRLISEHQGNGRVLFTGWLNGAVKRSALLGAALLAVPSYHENFCLSMAEALACAVPVLISRQMDLSREVEEAGAGWITDLEPDALRRALTDALRDKGERRARGAAGRALVCSRFTWTAVAEQLHRLYHSILSKE